jgi:two-component system, NtrC family, response regulator GlrR
VAPSPRTVLVVDDDASIRLLCRVNLELDGYRVLDAATLGEARALLETERVEALLLDVHVGTEDGYALLDELRAAEHGVRVALLTGSVDVGVRARQADAVLPKPFTIDALAATVRRLTDCGADVDSHASR